MTVAVLLAAGALWGGLTLRLETELLALFPPDLPSVRGLDRFQHEFVSDREVFLVLEGVPAGGASERVFEKLRPALAELPEVESVGTSGAEWLENAPELAAWAIWNVPAERFARVVAALAPGAVEKRLTDLPAMLGGVLDPEALVRLQLDPLGLFEVLDAEGADRSFDWSGRPAVALTLTARRPLVTFDECEDFWNAVHAVTRRVLGEKARVLLTGRPAFTAEIASEMRRDMRVMIAVAVVFVSAAFFAFYRSLRPLASILFGQFLALAVALIVARLAIGSLNVISMGFACILLGIGMDYSILVHHHHASHFRDDAAVWARLCRGIWFSAMTTAAAFLVLVFSFLPGLRQLAMLVAAGLLACAFFATWWLPAAWAARPPQPLPFLTLLSDAMAAAVTRHGRALLALALLAGVGAAVRIGHEPATLYQADLDRLQPATTAAFRGQRILAERDPSWRDAVYILEARSCEGVRQAADELARRVTGGRRSPESAFLPAPARQRENRALWRNGRNAAAARIRAAFEAAGLGRAWSATTFTLIATLDRAAAGAPDAFEAIAPLLRKLFRDEPDRCRAVVRLPEAAERPVPPGGLAIAGFEVWPVSFVSLKDELNQVALADLRRLSGFVLLAIFVLCALAQRSLCMVLLNFAALGLSLLLFGALLVTTGSALGPLSLLCVPLLIGLCIDYSLHVLMALEEQRDFGHLYAHIGTPILLTGIASCIGFGVPMLTRQPALQNFGLVMDLGIIAAVTTCLFVLPVLASLTVRRGRGR